MPQFPLTWLCFYFLFFILDIASCNLQLCFGVNALNILAQKSECEKGVGTIISSHLAGISLARSFYLVCFSVVRTFSRLGAHRVN